MRDYWEQRSTELELIIQKKTDETVKDINRIYSEAIGSVNDRVKAVFDRYSKNNGLTETQAKQLLNTKQTAEYRKLLLERIEKAEDKAARQAIIAVLDAPAYAYRISMLEALANEIFAEAVMLGVYENKALTNRLVDIYEQSYYRRTFDIQQHTGEYYNFEKLSSGRVRAAISEPWNGKNYSERVWDNTEQTAQKLREIVVKGIMTGQSYDMMEQALTATLGVDSDSGARFKASRLVRTEVNYISGKATTRAYEQADIEEYVFLATLDKKTCHDCGNESRKSCAELDGKRFKVSEAKVGVNKHPMHPFCRCSDYPYIPGRSVGVRSARDPKTGRSIKVPGDMTYRQWKNVFVDGGDKYAAHSFELGEIKYKDVYFDENADYSINIPDLPKHINSALSKSCENVARKGSASRREYLEMIDLDTGQVVYTEKGERDSVGDTGFYEYITKYPDKHLAFIHNHNTETPLSSADMQTFVSCRNIMLMSSVTNNGLKYVVYGDKITNKYLYTYYDDVVKRLTKDIANGRMKNVNFSELRERLVVEKAIDEFANLGAWRLDGRVGRKNN